MPSEEAESLQHALAPSFKAQGFLKDGATWRRESAYAIAVFNIQGSQWGRQFYLNLGAYLRELGDRDRPYEFHCHVRLRADELMPDRNRFNQLLDFDQPIDQRLDELADLVRSWAHPWLLAMLDREAAVAWLGSHRGISMFIAADARAVLRVDLGA